MRIYALKVRWRVPRYVWSDSICVLAMRIYALKRMLLCIVASISMYTYLAKKWRVPRYVWRVMHMCIGKHMYTHVRIHALKRGGVFQGMCEYTICVS